MQAKVVTDYIPVQNKNGDFLSVSLDGEMHHDMYQSFKKLPKLVEFQGLIYGKISWNSDYGLAYYKVHPEVAKVL